MQAAIDNAIPPPAATPFAAAKHIPAWQAKAYKRKILVKNKIKSRKHAKCSEAPYFKEEYFRNDNITAIIYQPFYQHFPYEGTVVASNFINWKQIPEDSRPPRCAILNLGNRPERSFLCSRKHFLLNTRPLTGTGFSRANYNILPDGIKNSCPGQEKIMEKQASSASQKYGSLSPDALLSPPVKLQLDLKKTAIRQKMIFS